MKYDVIVVGAGHAGVEAAETARRLGKKTALMTFSKNDVAQLPCNVSIGGSAKGILVREIFALGGIMPIASDNTQLQTKVLNTSKGPAVRALRSQVDKVKYPEWLKKYIESSDIDLIEGEVTDLIIDEDKVSGVICNKQEYKANAVILATGTFLDSKILIGDELVPSGPDGNKTNTTISKQLRDIGHTTIRLKTGTPPRIKIDTIDLTKQIEEPGSDKPIYFSEEKYVNKEFENMMAWVGYTNPVVHEIIENNIEKSYLYNDEITGSGPRYCPSIEDKVKRFNTKERHQIFLEIESKELNSMYLAGLSSSMPKDVQDMIVKSMKGFENAEFIKYGYAIEYDAIDPLELHQTLESKHIKNLYMAGQINGTSGYEEAAAQGLVAALNASRKMDGKDEIIFGRNNGYIGVMIDDITTKGIIDPYRLLTSRAEYRLLLRSDNAVKRLYKLAYEVGLISKERFDELEKRFDTQKEFIQASKEFKLSKQKEFNQYVKKNEIHLRQQGIKLFDFIKRPEVQPEDIKLFTPNEFLEKFNLTDEDLITIGIEIKFDGYIKRQEREVQNYLRYQRMKLPQDMDYSKVQNLAAEAVEKLNNFKPDTIAQASKISGINPSDIMSLVQHVNMGVDDE